MKKRKETRLTVVFGSDRVFERYDVEIEESIQDNGKTLKLFIKDMKQEGCGKRFNPFPKLEYVTATCGNSKLLISGAGRETDLCDECSAKAKETSK